MTVLICALFKPHLDDTNLMCYRLGLVLRPKFFNGKTWSFLVTSKTLKVTLLIFWFQAGETNEEHDIAFSEVMEVASREEPSSKKNSV